MANQSSDDEGLRELALFAGAGGGILGGKLLGWRTVCAVELDTYAASVLVARQNDGSLEPFPIWDDVRTFSGHLWRGRVDIISGGFPCQDISIAGRGKGINGERSGLWREMARIICEVRPQFVFVENSPALVFRGLDTVLGDLASLGYDARWGVLGAIHAGAPHRRERLWIVANSDSQRKLQSRGGQQKKRERVGNGGENVANSNGSQRKRGGAPVGIPAKHANAGGTGWWASEPAVGRMAHGVAHRVGQLRALGNGQVPSVAALAWHTLRP